MFKVNQIKRAQVIVGNAMTVFISTIDELSKANNILEEVMTKEFIAKQTAEKNHEEAKKSHGVNTDIIAKMQDFICL